METDKAWLGAGLGLEGQRPGMGDPEAVDLEEEEWDWEEDPKLVGLVQEMKRRKKEAALTRFQFFLGDREVSMEVDEGGRQMLTVEAEQQITLSSLDYRNGVVGWPEKIVIIPGNGYTAKDTKDLDKTSEVGQVNSENLIVSDTEGLDKTSAETVPDHPEPNPNESDDLPSGSEPSDLDLQPEASNTDVDRSDILTVQNEKEIVPDHPESRPSESDDSGSGSESSDQVLQLGASNTDAGSGDIDSGSSDKAVGSNDKAVGSNDKAVGTSNTPIVQNEKKPESRPVKKRARNSDLMKEFGETVTKMFKEVVERDAKAREEDRLAMERLRKQDKEEMREMVKEIMAQQVALFTRMVDLMGSKK